MCMLRKLTKAYTTDAEGTKMAKQVMHFKDISTEPSFVPKAGCSAICTNHFIPPQQGCM